MTLSTSKAVSVAAVTSSIGVNTHLDFSNYGYTNLATTEPPTNYLGLKNLRDSAANRRLGERPHLPQCRPDARRDDPTTQCGRAPGRQLAACHHHRDRLE